jgi:hypothetical protein
MPDCFMLPVAPPRLPGISLFIPLVFLMLAGPPVAKCQSLKLYGNARVWIAENQRVQAPDGLTVLDNARLELPATLSLNPGSVWMADSSASYMVYGVPPAAEALFFSKCTSGLSNLSVTNESNDSSSFSLRIANVAPAGLSALPVVWKLSQPVPNSLCNLSFSWDAGLEPVAIPQKRLFAADAGPWTELPLVNTSVNGFSLSYSGFDLPLNETRFSIARSLVSSASDVQSGTDGLWLGQNVPNPASGPSVIDFILPGSCTVEWIFTSSNGTVINRFSRDCPAGRNQELIPPMGSPGLYYCQLRTPYGALSRKMIVI